MENNHPIETTQSSSTTGYPIAVAYILPFVIYSVVMSFYPKFAESYENDLNETVAQAATYETWLYLGLLGLQILLAAGLIIFFRKVYLAAFPFKISPWSFVVGAVGIVLWVVLAELGFERSIASQLGLADSVARPGFNPGTIQDPGAKALFLVARFSVLVVVVPIVEELFLRGWVVKWVEDPNFGMTSKPTSLVSLKTLGTSALLSASIYGVLTHPLEAIAAFAWFGMVTLLARKTGSVWDCIIAHAVTNGLLGVYVLWWQQWHLW